jgi:hypothetical protein
MFFKEAFVMQERRRYQCLAEDVAHTACRMRFLDDRQQLLKSVRGSQWMESDTLPPGLVGKKTLGIDFFRDWTPSVLSFPFDESHTKHYQGSAQGPSG